jgi:hypothetical protein
MLNHLFPDSGERRLFKREWDDVMKRHDFWRKRDYKPSQAPKAYRVFRFRIGTKYGGSTFSLTRWQWSHCEQ